MNRTNETANKIPADLYKLMDSLLGAEKSRIFEQVGQKLDQTFRFNPLKGGNDLLGGLLAEQGFEFEPVEGQTAVFRLRAAPFSLGKSLSHFLGHIYVQDLASMVPPLVLAPRPGERVLDVSAAPGSKTTQMAAMMNNQGVILGNDVVLKRLRSLTTNLQRMGVLNTTLFKWFGEQFGNQYFEQFDRVLLDPACSGLGTLHKSPEVLSWWTRPYCAKLSLSQKKLIASAIKALRPGGVMTYSTCTLTPEENEGVVDYALRNFPVVLETIKLPGLKTRPGLTRFEGEQYSPDIRKAVRIYPFENQTEGFFIARLRKTMALEPPALKKPRSRVQMEFQTHKTSPVKKYLDFLSEHFQIPREEFGRYVYSFRNKIVAVSKEMAEIPYFGRPLQFGLTIGRAMDRGAKFSTEGCHLLGGTARHMVLDLPDLETLERFVNRETLNLDVKGRGQVIVKYRNCPIGYGICEDDRLRSSFPKAGWSFRLTPGD